MPRAPQAPFPLLTASTHAIQESIVSDKGRPDKRRTSCISGGRPFGRWSNSACGISSHHRPQRRGVHFLQGGVRVRKRAKFECAFPFPSSGLRFLRLLVLCIRCRLCLSSLEVALEGSLFEMRSAVSGSFFRPPPPPDGGGWCWQLARKPKTRRAFH